MNKKILTIVVITLLFSMCFVVAQNQQDQQNQQIPQKNNFISEDKNVIQKLEQHQNRFENRYNFECPNECNYKELNKNQTELQVRQEKRFLFWNVNAEETYVLDEEGNVIQAKYNFWSRILNQKRLRVEKSE